MAKAKGFTFFENYYECISDPENGLTDEERGACYNAIITYIFSGEVLPLKGAVKAIFTALRPSLDVSRNRSASGSAVKNIPEEDCEENESESKENQKEDEKETNGNQTEIKSETNGNQTKIKSEKLTFLEEIETRNKKQEINNIPPTCAHAREGEANAELDAFLDRHPQIEFDVFRHDDAIALSRIDFTRLEEKIQESDVLQNCKSLAFMAKNWDKINADQFKDFPSKTNKRLKESNVLQFSRLMGEYSDGG